MTAAVLALLALTVVGAGVAAGWADRRTVVTRFVTLALAGGWAVVAAASTAPRVTDVTVGPVVLDELAVRPALAATAAGMVLLVAARPPRSGFGCAVAIVSVGAFVVAGGWVVEGASTDWPLVVAAAVLVVGAVVGALAEGNRGAEVWAAVAGGAVVIGGLVIDDPEVRAGLALAGVAAVLLVAVATNRTGLTIAPALLFIALRVTEDLVADADATWHRVGAGVAIAGLLGAVVARRTLDSAPKPGSFAGPRLATAGFVAALILVAQDLDDLRAAGVLVAAGATLAVASGQRIGLVAFAPGVSAAAIAYRVADHPSHAAGALGIVALALVASIGVDRWRGRRSTVTPVMVPVAVGFAAVPSWGWSSADVGPDYGEGVAVAAAVGIPVAVVLLGIQLWSRAPDARPRALMSAATRPGPGSLARRRALVTARTADGTTNPHDVQEAAIDVDR